jgi:FlaA1/EpsC-like NDP-sugar epimerase
LIDGQSILITGGSGSFGSAFVRHLLKEHSPKRVIVFSRDEHKQARMGEEIQDSRLRLFIGDVRDRDRLRRAFEDVEIVVHAAALKRIEVGAYNPGEMVKTNILGAVNVIEASQDAGVHRVVALSTDKAYQPVSPYGQTKALAESLFLNANNTRGKTGPIFSVTRYGNVAGSAGSVIPKWRGMNGVVPVTDPECTRFWMTMDEAVALVVRTIETMRGGELNIPELPAYRLADLAEAMRARMNVIGLPDYEKLHESMADGNSSNTARRMNVDELREALVTV